MLGCLATAFMCNWAVESLTCCGGLTSASSHVSTQLLTRSPSSTGRGGEIGQRSSLVKIKTERPLTCYYHRQCRLHLGKIYLLPIKVDLDSEKDQKIKISCHCSGTWRTCWSSPNWLSRVPRGAAGAGQNWLELAVSSTGQAWPLLPAGTPAARPLTSTPGTPAWFQNNTGELEIRRLDGLLWSGKRVSDSQYLNLGSFFIPSPVLSKEYPVG